MHLAQNLESFFVHPISEVELQRKFDRGQALFAVSAVVPYPTGSATTGVQHKEVLETCFFLDRDQVLEDLHFVKSGEPGTPIYTVRFRKKGQITATPGGDDACKAEIGCYGQSAIDAALKAGETFYATVQVRDIGGSLSEADRAYDYAYAPSARLAERRQEKMERDNVQGKVIFRYRIRVRPKPAAGGSPFKAERDLFEAAA